MKFNKSVEYIEKFENIRKMLKNKAKKGDIILILGAGTIENLSKIILE